jgi:diguanylate cyclase (GGDEF)-like protein
VSENHNYRSFEPGSDRKTEILIVEDEGVVALHLRQRLASLGYKVTATVDSGNRALEEICARKPDLVIMDIHIKGEIDGIETARSIPAGLQMPVIYLSAFCEEATLERARATKPYGYLLKPFSERELHATIQMALERHKLELALRRSEQRLGLALDSAEMGAWELDVASRTVVHLDRTDPVVAAAPAPDIFTGAWETLLDQIYFEDRPLLEKMFEQLSGDNVAREVEFRWPGQDGVRWMRVRGKQFSADAAGANRIIGVIQDVTESREKADRLRRTAADLAAQREELSEALSSANVASRAKSDFLAVMSHELRTPMNAILGFGQLLDRSTVGPLNQRQHEYIGHILQSGGYLLDLIDDLLDLGKLEAAKLPIKVERVDLAPLLERVAASLDPLAWQHKIAVTTSARGDLAASADRTRLIQALTNLVSNAIKYNRPGGAVHINDEVLAGGRVRIKVADTGIGIPAARQREMFIPFNRLGAEDGTIEGTGIGLPICKRLVELMGGHLGFESTTDIGSEFWIDLPAHAVSGPSPVPQDPLTGLPNRLLLNDRVSQAIALAPRHAKKVAVLSVGLDGFKHIDDSLRHPIDDKMIRSVARSLVDSLRGSDTVSRQDGDVFVVLLSEVNQPGDVAVATERMLRAVAPPLAADAHDLPVNVRIGVSIYPDDALDAETLLRKAASAMRLARKSEDETTDLATVDRSACRAGSRADRGPAL